MGSVPTKTLQSIPNKWNCDTLLFLILKTSQAQVKSFTWFRSVNMGTLIGLLPYHLETKKKKRWTDLQNIYLLHRALNVNVVWASVASHLLQTILARQLWWFIEYFRCACDTVNLVMSYVSTISEMFDPSCTHYHVHFESDTSCLKPRRCLFWLAGWQSMT